jgi:CHRD domain-containing protein
MNRVRGRIAVVCLLLCWAAAALAQTSKAYKARLSTVPMDLTMASTVAGTGLVTATLAGRTLTINGTFEGLRSPATIAQVHKSPVAGVRGPVLFDLKVSSGTDGTITGTIELTPAQRDDLDKRRLYVQLHSEKAPDGNLWGWLIPQETRR